MKQFFSKQTFQVFVRLSAVLLLGLAAWLYPELAAPLLLLAAIAVYVISRSSLLDGLLIAFSEVIAFGHGHLVHADFFSMSVSLRMVIFAAVMFAFLELTLRKKVRVKTLSLRDAPWVLLGMAVILGSVIGFLSNTPSLAFDDMNGYLFAAYILPVATIRFTNTQKHQLLSVLAAGALFLSAATLGLSYVFTHFDGDMLDPVYRFVRDTRLFEVTLLLFGSAQNVSSSPILLMTESFEPRYWFRIFTPNHFFVGIFLLLMIALGWFHFVKQRIADRVQVGIVLAAATQLLSFSRSIWLGLFFAVGFIKLTYLKKRTKRWGHFFKRGISYVVLLFIAGFLAVGSVMIPIPERPDLKDASFYETSASIGRAAAVSSRWSLLDPLMSAVQEAPLFGSGFGKEVTFITDDPRAREQSETGEWTTYRFEWGWIDIWLKMGLLGLIAYGWYFLVMLQVGAYTARKHGHPWLPVGLIAGLVALYVAHIFTPLLNHPIGIMYMLILMPFMDFDGFLAFQKEKEKQKKKFELPRIVPESVTTRE